MLKIGVLGSNSLIDTFIETILQQENASYVGTYSTENYESKFEFSKSLQTTIEQSELLCILPSDQQYNFALKAIAANKHIYLHQPFLFTEFQLQKIAEVAEEADVICVLPQNTYLNNDIIKNIKSSFPILIDINNNTAITISKNDTLVKELLIDEIDALLYIFDKATIRRSTINSFNISMSAIDLIDLSLQFDNGSVAHMIVSSLLQKEMEHNLLLYAKDRVISYKLGLLSSINLNTVMEDCIALISSKTAPKYSIYNAIRSMNVTQKIVNKMNLGTLQVKF